MPKLDIRAAIVFSELEYRAMRESGIDNERTALIGHEERTRHRLTEQNSWPRARQLGWLFSNGRRYPPPTLPPKLRGLQGDLDSAWSELEHQHITANRYNLLSTCLALLITTSGAVTTAMANGAHSKTAAMFLGTFTTIAGTIITGLRATGQPKRAHDRFKRLDKIIDHITRLYYEFGQIGPTHPGLDNSEGVDENGLIERAIVETWKMIDDEDLQTELEERRFVPFGYSANQIPGLVDQVGGNKISNNNIGNFQGNCKLQVSNLSVSQRAFFEQTRGGRPLLTSARSQRNLSL